MKIRLFGLTLSFWFLVQLVADERVLLPPAIANLVNEGKEALLNKHFEGEALTVDASKRFDQAMERLTEIVDEKLIATLRDMEAQSIDVKLVLIAWDRKKRPELYEEIRQTYVCFPLDRRYRNPWGHPPPLQEKHSVEEYRIVWEYFILAPRGGGETFGGSIFAVQALPKIRNDASLVTLVYEFGLTCREGAGLAGTNQSGLLGAIAGFKNDKAVRALLKCAEIAKNEKPRKHYDTNLEIVGSILASKEFETVLKAFPVDSLAVDEHELFERLLADGRKSREEYEKKVKEVEERMKKSAAGEK